MKSVDLGGKHSSGILWSQSVQSDVTEKKKWDEKKWEKRKWEKKSEMKKSEKMKVMLIIGKKWVVLITTEKEKKNDR